MVGIALAISYTTSLAAAAVLLPAGVVKIRRPIATARALYAADLPASFALVRCLGVIEVVVGGSTIVITLSGVNNSIAYAALGALYAVFAAFLIYVLLSHKPLASCGCAGGADLPPTWLHASLNVVVVAAASLVVVSPRPAALPTVQQHQLVFVAWLANVIVLSVVGSFALLRASSATAVLSAGSGGT